jgi:hypothetical protein
LRFNSGERLEAWTLHPAGENGELVLLKRGLLDGSLVKYDIYERASADPSPGKGATPDAPAAPPWTPFLGSWTASDGSLWSFNAGGSYVVTPSSGGSEEYRYLARRDKLVTISRGETETVNGLIQWKTFPRVSEQTFAISEGGSVIKLGGGLTLSKNESD